MAVRSLNKVMLIGNLTRDPELRYTPSGTAVVTFSVATNREWTLESGEKREEVEFTRIVAWNKLAELCSQLLTKGRKVFVEGRLQTRNWTAQDGSQRVTTEVVISDMIILDSRRPVDAQAGSVSSTTQEITVKKIQSEKAVKAEKTEVKDDKKESKKQQVQEDVKTQVSEEVNPDDIPF